MESKRVGSQASAKGAAEDFSGAVWVDILFRHRSRAESRDVKVTDEQYKREVWRRRMGV